MKSTTLGQGKKALAERWDPSVLVDFDEAPFGYTEGGYKDFRGLPYVSYEKIYYPRPFKVDLSHADFSGTDLKGLEFIDCRFTGTNFNDIYESKCSFHGCVFRKCDFRMALIGFRTSRYEDCVFEACNFLRASFKNAVYRRCAFLDNRFGNSFLDATGFWDCRFTGKLYGLVFRGTYLYEEDNERYGHPVETGLHKVDFSEARLEMTSCRGGCALENITLPRDGSSCLIDTKELIEDLPNLLASFTEHAKNIKIALGISILEPNIQPTTICSLYDMKDSIEDDEVGQAIYEMIKARYGISSD